jgi:hypothetical protein
MFVAALGLCCARAEALDSVEGAPRSPGDVKGRFLVGAQTGLLHASRSSTDDDAVGLGDGRTSGTSFGVSAGGTVPYLVVGYGLGHDWLLSGSFSARRATSRYGEERQTSTELEASPELTYLFGDGPVRPYAGAHGTMLTASGDVEHLGLGGGAHGGLRFEVTEHLSLEPLLFAGYHWRKSHYAFGVATLDSETRSVVGSGALRLGGWF